MEQPGNIPISNIPQNFMGNFFRIYWGYHMGMFHEYSTNIYLPGGLGLKTPLSRIPILGDIFL